MPFLYWRVRHDIADCCKIKAQAGETFGFVFLPALKLRNWNLTTAILASEANVLFSHVIGVSSGEIFWPCFQAFGKLGSMAKLWQYRPYLHHFQLLFLPLVYGVSHLSP